MADLIELTGGPITTSGGWQALDEVVDVSGYDVFDFEVGVLGITGSPTTAELIVYTSMYKKKEASSSSPLPWTDVRTRTLTAPDYDTFFIPDANTPVLRFIRYYINLAGGTNPTVTLQIAILARRKSI